MLAVRISSKFQTVIPKRIRQHLNFKPGQRLQVFKRDGRTELAPEKDVASLRGFPRGIDATLGGGGARRGPLMILADSCEWLAFLADEPYGMTRQNTPWSWEKLGPSLPVQEPAFALQGSDLRHVLTHLQGTLIAALGVPDGEVADVDEAAAQLEPELLSLIHI